MFCFQQPIQEPPFPLQPERPVPRRRRLRPPGIPPASASPDIKRGRRRRRGLLPRLLPPGAALTQRRLLPALGRGGRGGDLGGPGRQLLSPARCASVPFSVRGRRGRRSGGGGHAQQPAAATRPRSLSASTDLRVSLSAADNWQFVCPEGTSHHPRKVRTQNFWFSQKYKKNISFIDLSVRMEAR